MTPNRTRPVALFCLAILCTLSFVLPARADAGIKVTWVFDGDTIGLSDGSRVRYTGINTPETAHDGRPAEPFAREALALNKRLTLDKSVMLKYDQERRDHYGRLLAYVFLDDGTFVNAVLVEEGLATVYATPPNLKYDSDLLKLQRRAMGQRKGLWSAVGPGKEAFYIGNTRSRRFHSPSCPLGQRTARTNATRFKDRLAAYYAGFSPCKKCNP